MTLKSKKILSNQKNHRINIRSKQRGGSKYTIVGHDKNGATANKSDLTSDGYLLSKYDVTVVEDFLRNVKGDNSDFYELSEKSRGTDGLDEVNTTTKFNVFVDKLQQIITNTNTGRSSGEDNLLVETGNPSGIITNELGKPDGTSNKKNVEINTKFLRDVLQKISSSEQQMVLSQQFRASGPEKPGGVERKALVRDSDSSFQDTPLLGEKDDTHDPTGRKDYRKLPTVNKPEEIENVKILLEDLKQVYTKYRKKYEKQGGNEKFESNYFKGDEAKDSKLLYSVKTTFQKDLKDKENQKRFRSLDSGLRTDTGENYFFSKDGKDTHSHLEHKFDEYTETGLDEYSKKRKGTNVMMNMSLGEGINEQTTTDTSGAQYKGRMGFEITDIDSEEIRDRYEWCYLMERIYLFKHMELLQLVINISYIINSLFVMYFLFTRIVRLRDISDKACPVPKQVVLPPTYRKIIQNYFNTQRGDLIHINNQIRDTVVGIQNVLNSSMGVTNLDSNVNNGIPKEYKDFAVSSDFLNKPLSFASYNHLIKSSKLHIPTIYLFPNVPISANKDDLRNAIIKKYPGDKKNLVINVRFDESVYRSRKMEPTPPVTYNDKYRYRKETSATHPPIKIIVSKADSYENIKKFFNELTKIPATESGAIVTNLDFSNASVKDLHELSFIKYKSSNEELLDIEDDNFDGDDGVFVKDTSGNLGQKVGNFRALKKEINITDTKIELITPQNLPNGSTPRNIVTDFSDGEKVKINEEILTINAPPTVGAPDEFLTVSRGTPPSIHKVGDIVIGEGKIDTPISGTASIVANNPTSDALVAATAAAPTLNTVTGDVAKTASLIVNLKKIPVLGENSIKDFLYGRTSGPDPKPKGLLTAMKITSDKIPDVVYFNIYRNQLKIVLGFSEEFTDQEIDNSLKELEKERNNIFVGEFEQQDKTRSIIYTSLQQTGGSFQTGGATTSRDDYNQDDSTFSGKVKEIYQNEPIPNPSKFKEYTYGYKVGSTYKIPFSLTEDQVEKFKELGNSPSTNPYMFAAQHDTYQKFKFSNQEQLQNYINQYKNIKELVTDSKVNNSQLKSMIDFLSDPKKKSLHDFKQGVLRRDLKINSLVADTPPNVEYTVIKTEQPHGLKVGDMVNVKAEGTGGTEPYLFNDIALEVLALGDKFPSGGSNLETKFIVNVGEIDSGRFTFATGTVTAFPDEFDVHRLNLLDSKVDGMSESELYSPEHIQLYLNRCYELEKLYIIKHHEFLYMKNVFDKAFIFYLMSFIVFFYYVKSLGRVEKKKCKDSLIRIPKTFLGDIDLMVKNQKNIMENFTQETPFKTIQSVIEQDKPKYSLSGGSLNLSGGYSPSIEKSINSVILELKELINFINETHSKKNYKNFLEVFSELKKNKSERYKNAKDYLEKIIKEKETLMGKTDRTIIDEKKLDKINNFLDGLDNFISGVCGGETSTESSSMSNTSIICKKLPSINIDNNITNILDANEKPSNFNEGLKNQIENQTNKIKFVNNDEVNATLANKEKSFDEKFDNILDNLPTAGTELEDSVTLNVFSRDEIENIRELFKLVEQGVKVSLTDGKYEAPNGKLEFEMSEHKLALFGAKVEEDTSLNKVKNIEFSLVNNNNNNQFLNSIQTLLKNDADEYRDLINSQQKLKDLFLSLISLNETVTKGENKFLSENTKSKDKANFSELDYIVSNYSNILSSVAKIYKKKAPYPPMTEINTKYKMVPSDNNEYQKSFMNAIKDNKNKKFILNLTSSDVYDCIASMNNIVDKNLEKQKYLSYIDAYNKKKDDKTDKLNEVLEFLQINFRFLKIYGENNALGDDETLIKNNIYTKFTQQTANVLKALVYAFFGGDNTNEKIIKNLTKSFIGTGTGTETEINIGEQIYNIYKNYIEFKRMTQEFKIGSFSINAEVIPDGAKEQDFNKKATEIIEKYEDENEKFKPIIDILSKYFIQGVTKFEFLKKYDSLYNNIYDENDLDNLLKEPTNEEGVGPSISKEDLDKLKILVDDATLSSINDVHINKEIASFKESFMGAARVFVLVRDTANKKVPPELPFAGGYGKQMLGDANGSSEDYKNFKEFRASLQKLEKEGEKNNENFSLDPKKYGPLKKDRNGKGYYRVRIQGGKTDPIYTSGPVGSYKININFDTIKDSLKYDPTTNNLTNNSVVNDTHTAVLNTKTIEQEDKLQSIIDAVEGSRISFQITKVDGKVNKNEMSSLNGKNVDVTLELIDTENVLPLYSIELFYNKRQGNVYRAMGDAFLMPLSENYEREGMFKETFDNDTNKTIGTQEFESECVLLPSQKYLNIPNGGYEPYPWMGIDKEKVGKVFGPFRKVAFHSDPPKLFNKEFGDINDQILGTSGATGGSAVFFGYGFSGSGKTYTLMDKKAPGFLKTIVGAQIKKGNKIKSVYVKELYPYFPGHMEPETIEEVDLNILDATSSLTTKLDSNDKRRLREFSSYSLTKESPDAANRVLESENDLSYYHEKKPNLLHHLDTIIT
jgi:hypothetical protein